jgi:hypothetical protein
MARTHARILVTIWGDPDFRALSIEAQRMYLLLLSQGSLNNAGVLPLTAKRWAAGCADTTTGHIEKALHELDVARFVAADDDTEEVLIRSFIRNDGIVKQPQMMKSALREALTVESPRLRSVLAAELRKLRREDAAFTAEQIDPGFDPDPDPGDRSPIQAQGSLLEGFDQPSSTPPAGSAKAAELRRGGEGVGESLSVRTTSVKSAAKRGARISESFSVTQDMVVWARRECPDVDGKFETDQFIDYWMAKAGAQAVKLDWVRTWQTWMRRQQRDYVERGPRLRSVPASPVKAFDSFEEYREAAAGDDAARLLGIAYLPDPQRPSDPTPPQQFRAARAVEWIDAHESEIRTALAERKTG